MMPATEKAMVAATALAARRARAPVTARNARMGRVLFFMFIWICRLL
jgi:hypothetical protein